MIWSVDFASGAGSGDTPDGGGAPIVYSMDGSCGPQHKNTSCSANTDAYSGTCCSSSGYCGSTSAYCGAGCTSGCDGQEVTGGSGGSGGGYTGPVVYSTDGSCGPQHNDTFCSASSNAYSGTCCSSSGYCGNGVSYCGLGCVSGCNGQEVKPSSTSSVGPSRSSAPPASSRSLSGTAPLSTRVQTNNPAPPIATSAGSLASDGPSSDTGPPVASNMPSNNPAPPASSR